MKIDINDELEILCLTTEIRNCPSRERLNKHFGFHVDTICPARKKLKEHYDRWKAEQRSHYEPEKDDKTRAD